VRREKKQSKALSLSWRSAWRVRAPGPTARGPRVSGGGVCLWGLYARCESRCVSPSPYLHRGLSDAISPASLCLSPSVRLSRRLSSSPAPPLSLFSPRARSPFPPLPFPPPPSCASPPPSRPPPALLLLAHTLSHFGCLLQADLWSAQGLSLAKR
jgi:hypothetical protein